MLSSWGNGEFSGETASEVARIQEAVASLRKDRVASKIEEQLALNLKAAEREIGKSQESIQQLQAGASEAADALLRATPDSISDSYERLKAALQLLEREAGEALMALEWHQETRRMFDAHGLKHISRLS